MRLYSMPSSGNSYKVRLLLALTGRHCERIDLESATPELEEVKQRGLLPFGKLPALELDDGSFLAESNALLIYFGEGSSFVPSDAATRARMFAWMFWEQYNHEPVIAVRAALRCYPDRAHLATPERMQELLDRGHELLGVMDQHLQHQDWLAGNSVSLADICLFAYTHSAEARGGFEMQRFEAVTRWLARIASLPGWLPLSA